MAGQQFQWLEPGTNDADAQRTYYKGFMLGGVEYRLGEACFMQPESDNQPSYVGRLVGAYADRAQGSENQCVQVREHFRAQVFPRPTLSPCRFAG